ncbi:hypothetical protein BDV06DRAFT_225966 [Aspergillus oleicola]
MDEKDLEAVRHHLCPHHLPEPSEPIEHIATTAERGYYRYGQTFIKRSLREREFKVGYKGIHVPILGKERLQNEAASLLFIASASNIPVPALHGEFEFDGAYFVMTEYIEGEQMAQLDDNRKATVLREIKEHLDTFQGLTSTTTGGPSGIAIPPYRILRHHPTRSWSTQSSKGAEYVFCHNDLSQHNIIVDPQSLKINATIDWEYAGFYPPYFEAPFYQRPGPSVALDGEENDECKLAEFLGLHGNEGHGKR